jgi:hypothetical protein
MDERSLPTIDKLRTALLPFFLHAFQADPADEKNIQGRQYMHIYKCRHVIRAELSRILQMDSATKKLKTNNMKLKGLVTQVLLLH